jgi:hydroxymethylbilane synthase
MSEPRTIRIGTRGSELARRQAAIVGEAIQKSRPSTKYELRVIQTEGDARSGFDLSHFEGQGVFVRRIELALLSDDIDIAVHSFKDMPTAPTDGLLVAAFLAREDARDALVTRDRQTLGQLPPGSVIGTGSPRRQALLRDARNDLDVRGIRGNVDTRLRRALEGNYDGVVVAAAGLRRLGREREITELLDPARFTPAVGQGILAVQVRADDNSAADLVRPLDDPQARACAMAERAVAQTIAAGCQTPLGAFAEIVAGRLLLSACLAAVDGRLVRATDGGGADECEAIGVRVGAALLDKLRPDVSKSGPLVDRKILVTRPVGQAPRFVEALRSAGAEPIELPAISIQPPGSYESIDAAIRRRDYDWLVFTSANGVRFFHERLVALGEGSDWIRHSRVAAIGPETARALATIGITADLVPDEYVAEALVASLADAVPLQGQRVLLPRADIARDALSTGLLREGAIVESVVAYRTVPAPSSPEIEGQLRAGAIDAVTFTSSSTVRAFLGSLSSNDALSGVTLACIGPITAETLREAGLGPSVVAQTYTISGLVEALSDYYGAGAQLSMQPTERTAT